MNTTFQRSAALFLLAGGLWASAAVAQCTTAAFYVDLKTGAVLNGDPTFYTVLSPPAPSGLADCAGWLEAVVQVEIPPSCTAATVSAEYEGGPRHWTLNIGDSPTNDGYSGDAGTTPWDAELWVEDEYLALASAGTSPLAIDSPIVYQHAPLTDGALKFLVQDQFVSWSQPYELVQTAHNRILFAVPDPTMKPGQQRSIYVGMNRVIYGAPWNGRTGCGLRSALIRFQ